MGATRENRAEALRGLRTELLIAGPIALLLATALGYVLAGGGLRAVEDMRARAAEISADRPGERLPVPPTGDELERLGVTLNAMLARLEAALERERGFVAEAGHELRTPLATLRAELDFALHHADSEAELRDALRAASEETDRLVAARRLAAADGQLRPGRGSRCSPSGSPADDAARRACATASPGAPRPRGGPISIDAPYGLTLTATACASSRRSATWSTTRCATAPARCIRVERRGDRSPRCSVRDEGTGFPADFLPHAFERFSRAEEGHSGEGAGLGLAIVDAIARAHGGSARVRNATGHGAEASLLLPAAQSESASVTRSSTPR